MSIVGANNIVSTYRLETASSKDEYSATANLSGLCGYLEPVSPEIAVIYGNENAYTTYKCYIDGVHDIIVSDKVIDENADEYIVQGVQIFQGNTDVPNHTEITIVKKFT